MLGLCCGNTRISAALWNDRECTLRGFSFRFLALQMKASSLALRTVRTRSMQIQRATPRSGSTTTGVWNGFPPHCIAGCAARFAEMWYTGEVGLWQIAASSCFVCQHRKRRFVQFRLNKPRKLFKNEEKKNPVARLWFLVSLAELDVSIRMISSLRHFHVLESGEQPCV